jgi:rfaE bifunctional protein nucleotidyltransferase chain/domain
VGQVAVTRGARGAVLVQDQDGHPLVVPARPVAGDTCGAGDVFAVALAQQLGLGHLPSQAMSAAVEAAGAFVEGSTWPAPKFGAEEDALVVAARIRARGGRIVGAGGCFDLLHPGHLSLLQQARALGDCLIVCLNSDASVARLKGKGRPVVAQDGRSAILRALSCVDGVLVFEEDTPDRALEALRPDMWVKGGDYAGRRVPESDLVERWGGQVVVVPYLAGRSTTALIEQVCQEAVR